MTLRPAARRALAVAGLLLIVLAAGALAAGLWFRGRIMATLPRLDGTSALRGLAAPVRVTRDALGVPTVAGSSRIDVARATGWLHAQDRFFQMDLLRRRGAGELSELFGKATLSPGQGRTHARVPERRARGHGAGEPGAKGDPGGLRPGRERGLGLAGGEALGVPGPPSGAKAMACRGQRACRLRDDARPPGQHGAVPPHARRRSATSAARPPSRSSPPFHTADDAPLDGSAVARGARSLPPRRSTSGRAPPAATRRDRPGPKPRWGDPEAPGSNNFAVAGALAGGGPAIVANDMHLHLGVPNTWYRMSLRWPGHSETGVTLPGAPALVAEAREDRLGVHEFRTPGPGTS